MNAPWLNSFPSDWQKIRLRNLVKHVRNGSWGDEPEDGDGVVCIRAADFDREHQRLDNSNLVRRSFSPDELKKHLLQVGDLVLEKSGGGDQQPVGAAILFDEDFPAVATNFAARIRPRSLVEPRFLAYVLAATYDLGINQRSIKQTTGIQNLDTGSFFSEPWAVPHLSQQRTIADFLDRETRRIDALITTKLRLAQALRTRRKGLVDHILNRAKQRLVRVKHAVHSITSGPRGWSEYYSDEGRAFLRITNVSSNSIELLLDDLVRVAPPEGPEARRTRADTGDVLVSITAEIGSVGVIPENLAGSYVSQHLALLRTNHEAAEPHWLALSLFGSTAQAQLDSARYGGTKTQLALDDVTGIRIPLPSVDRQRSLLAEWRSKDEALARALSKLDQQLDLLREHRQALITAAVTGQLEVTKAA